MFLSACTIRVAPLCLLLSFFAAAQDGDDPNAADLIRAVRASENWIHDVNSFYLRTESTWTKTPKGIAARAAELKERFPDAVLDPNRWTGLRPYSQDSIEIAFDRRRLRYLRDDPNASRTEKVWDGHLAVSHENYVSHHQEHFYLANDPNRIFRYLLSDLSWLRSRPHSFWWYPMDVEQHLDFFGRPEDFELVRRKVFRWSDRHVLEYERQGLTTRWYIDAEGGRLRKIAYHQRGRVTSEHWLNDYRQVAPGCWLPMTQGYAFYDRDESGQDYLNSRRDMKIVEIRINEPLPDEMFQVELKEGVEVQDYRGGRFQSYIYVPPPASLLGRPIPDFNDITFDRRPADEGNGPLLICFCDTNQRPSRHCLRQLTAKADDLAGRGIAVLTIQAESSNQPVTNVHESFGLGKIRRNHKHVRFTWGVQSLPWLILTDANHIVQAEGFPFDEINAVPAGTTETQK